MKTMRQASTGGHLHCRVFHAGLTETMTALQAWLAAAPQGAIAILTAGMAALVAVLVTALTQWILGRRARTEFLTRKLEELYLALNEISAHSVKRVEVPYRSLPRRRLTSQRFRAGLSNSKGLIYTRRS